MSAERMPTSSTPEAIETYAPDRSGRRWATRFARAAAAVALAVLATWWLDRWSWLSLGARYVPMAPGTALLVLTLSAAVLLRARKPTAAASLAAAALLASTVILGAALLDIPLDIEAWLSGTDARVSDVPVGRVSLYTAALLLLLALGLTWKHVRPGRAKEEVVIALTVMGACFVILQGYVLGGPLFYGTGTIPVAAMTALALFFLGLAFLLLVGTAYWPLRLIFPPAGDSGLGSRWTFRATTLLISAVVVSSGYLWHRGEQRRAEERARTTLEAVADLKADQLSEWYAGHLSTARALRSIPVSLGSAGLWLANLRLG
ncbi:MAG: hypothetical protein WD995_09890, partial [Gemmatimonadota bacterium]